MNIELHDQFGNIDIYLFDQLLKGNITKDMRILDAGCGSGRNLRYLLQSGYNVYALDRSEEAIQQVQRLGEKLTLEWSTEHARVESLEYMSFADASFDFVISSAVLHFAEDERHFDQMVQELWRVLKPGGRLFVRLASSIGIENLVKPLGNQRYILPDGSTRFLVDEEQLRGVTTALQGELFEPIKTTIVAGQRCMTTWCVRKRT
ncbi:hypothetical protein PMSM_18455 [Paenibacillus macquariensis subsp. macquariensis]|uniref:Methyltransferase domain-containing protein n=2 Tax=Paenibacillus macquariensis TaxID=948756 RepID=A0ABY1K4Q6_9BACL|nr:hypothetical protein PMSM_18455 [Paenibacillus macquariensis subsp. macquariensis]SIR25059.1 Methyltransferase domain-containing protein [Paenibacillus macquariensis]